MSIITEVKELLTPKYDVRYTPDLLLEINKKILMRNTDKGRKWRARYQVRTRPMSATMINEKTKTWMLEYNFKAYPSTEEKRHWGYIIYDEPNKDITQVFCGCRDFWFRLWAPYVRAKLANYNNYPLYKKYKKDEKNTWPTPHNHQWTKIRNPDGKLYLCKHLYAALSGYVED
jgi:hypothetical protein